MESKRNPGIKAIDWRVWAILTLACVLYGFGVGYLGATKNGGFDLRAGLIPGVIAALVVGGAIGFFLICGAQGKGTSPIPVKVERLGELHKRQRENYYSRIYLAGVLVALPLVMLWESQGLLPPALNPHESWLTRIDLSKAENLFWLLFLWFISLLGLVIGFRENAHIGTKIKRFEDELKEGCPP